MGFRFNKRIKIAKGITLNVGKKGISTSVKAGGVTFNSRGRITASIPKTGISYSTNLKSKKKAANHIERVPVEKNKWITIGLCVFLGIVGAHKFYEGKVGLGILYFLTIGLGGIGIIYDIIMLLFKPNKYLV